MKSISGRRIGKLSLVACCAMLITTSGCASRGLTRLNQSHGDYSREVFLYVPAALQSHTQGVRGSRPPLLLVLHGGGGKASRMARATNRRFHELADRHDFIVAYPQGIDKSWNDGRKVGISTAIREQIDDVGFMRGLIARLEREYDIDSTRVFATGISNGGFMSFRLACDLGDKIRGVAPITATLSEDLSKVCRPARPGGMLIINGTADPLVPYQGGEVRLFQKGRGRGKILSTDATLEFFRRRNGCGPRKAPVKLPDQNTKDDSSVSRIDFNCPPHAPLRLLRVEGGGHTWPGARQYLPQALVGPTNRDINACDRIVEFFLSIKE